MIGNIINSNNLNLFKEIDEDIKYEIDELNKKIPHYL